MARNNFPAGASAAVGVLVLLLSAGVLQLQGVDAGCTVQNNSKKAIVIVPVDVTVSVTIEVAAGASVVVPASQQHCKLRNKESGHELGPYTLPDKKTVVCIDGSVEGTVDVWVGGLLAGLLQLVLNICVSL